MNRFISPGAWTKHLEELDSTSSYISSGGSCIRVITSQENATHAEVSRQLSFLADSHGLKLLQVSHENCHKIHVPQIVLRSLTQQIDLNDVFMKIARKVWKESGFSSLSYSVEDISIQYPDFDRIFLQRQFNSTITRMLENESKLTNEWQRIVRRIALSIVESSARGALDIALLESALIQTATRRDLAELGLLRPIRTYNTTPTIQQLLALHKVAGWKGVVLHFDFRWATDPQTLEFDTPSKPTSSNRNDIYQWVRELIDLTADFTSTLICVEFGPSFLDPDPRGRGMGSYQALRLRLEDGVRPKSGPNPSAVLVPLSAR